jgi:lysophospholipase L1-like esterase
MKERFTTIVCMAWIPLLAVLVVGMSIGYAICANKPEKPVLICTGDSITEGGVDHKHDVGYGLNDITCQYPFHLQKLLPGWEVRNHGVGGEVTAQMLWRFGADVISDRPQAVVILAGTNDILLGVPFQQTTTHLRKMYEAAQRNNITPIACLIPPSHRYTKAQRTNLDNLNVWIATYCTAKKITFVDTHSALLDPEDNTQMLPAYSDDNLHPNPLGYEVIAKTIVQSTSLHER